MVLSPNGRTLYALSGNGVNGLVPINTATSKPGREIRVGCFEGDLVITPNGKTIYIVCPVGNAVIPVNTHTGKAGRRIRVGDFPGPIAVTPDGKTVFVGNRGSASVTPIAQPWLRASRDREIILAQHAKQPPQLGHRLPATCSIASRTAPVDSWPVGSIRRSAAACTTIMLRPCATTSCSSLAMRERSTSAAR